MKKFILIDHEPWTIRRKQLFYDLFKDAGVPLKVWDLSQWLHPDLHMSDEISDEYVTKVTCENDFRLLLRSEDPNATIIVEEIIKFWKYRNVFRLISDFGFNSIKIDQYGNGTIPRSLKEKISSLVISYIPGIIKRKLLGQCLKWYDKFHKVKNPIRILSSNQLLYRTDAFNHPDYERFRFSKHKRVVEGNYIVFCDIFFPYHPDLRHYYNLNKIPDGEKYQESMRRYFDFLESKYRMPVIIAAHPKSDYKGDEFGSRPIIKYQTDNLIAFADMVTLHNCNSISYSILFNKPIAYVGTDDYLSMNNVKGTFPILANKILGLEIYNIDRIDFSAIQFNKIDPILRKRYIQIFLTSYSTKDISNVEILRKILPSI